MCAEWLKEYDPDHLAVRLEESKSTTHDGRVSFNGFGFTEYIVVLTSMVSLDKAITEYEKNNIVRNAAFSLAQREARTALILFLSMRGFTTVVRMVLIPPCTST